MITRFVALSGAAALALLAGTATAQIVQNGNSDLNAINSGDITLHGTVTNPTISGGIENSVGNLAAQGAATNYSINDANIGADGQPLGTSTASVSNTRLSGTNSGTVNVQTGGQAWLENYESGDVSGGTLNLDGGEIRGAYQTSLYGTINVLSASTLNASYGGNFFRV
jgi:hypothetical protein